MTDPLNLPCPKGGSHTWVAYQGKYLCPKCDTKMDFNYEPEASTPRESDSVSSDRRSDEGQGDSPESPTGGDARESSAGTPEPDELLNLKRLIRKNLRVDEVPDDIEKATREGMMEIRDDDPPWNKPE